MNDPQDEDSIKNREIRFASMHAELDQAQKALLLLSDLEGIIEAHSSQKNVLFVSYDIRFFTLNAIEKALANLGFHLDNSLLQKMKRAFYQYTEEIQRDNLGLDSSHQTTREVFISRYQKLKHGCRDCRPEHWRNYW